MKRVLSVCAALACACPLGAKAQGFYAGIDHQPLVVVYQEGQQFLPFTSFYPGSLSGWRLYGGLDLLGGFSAEFGYLFTTRREQTHFETVRTGVQMQGATLDAVYALPLGIGSPLRLLGIAGFSYLGAETRVSDPDSGSRTHDAQEFGLRLGFGGEYRILGLGFRGTAIYQGAEFDGLMERVLVFGLGMNIRP